MRFLRTGINGAYLVELEPHSDERGMIARTYCRQAFAEAGLHFEPIQCNISCNPAPGTLRGMHYQKPPHEEAKLVQCVGGRIHDVAVDLRRSSSTFGRWAGVELSAAGTVLFYIPAGCAHGFVTLEPHCNVFYYMGAPFVAGTGTGVRWDDPAFAIDWPLRPKIISDRDCAYPDFDPSVDGLP